MDKYLATITRQGSYCHKHVGQLDAEEYEHFSDLGIPEGKLAQRGSVHNNTWTEQGIFNSERKAKAALRSR